MFADKLTTLGPTTIGIQDSRADEQFKQIYDIITLFTSNTNQILSDKERIYDNYIYAAKVECTLRGIAFELEPIYRDMKSFIDRIKNIEEDNDLLQHAMDFQSLYLRKAVNRNKADWAVVGYQLEMLTEYLFNNNTKILNYEDIEELLFKLKFENIQGPERGRLINTVRAELASKFNTIDGLSPNLFRKSFNRIIWELASTTTFSVIANAVNGFL